MKSADEIVGELGLDPAKKTAFVFSHVLYDATFWFGENLFDDYIVWLVETAKAAAANANVNWVIKLHPENVRRWEETTGRYALENLEEYRLLVDLFPDGLPDHIRLMTPENDTSTLSLFEFADYALTVRGTIGLEFPCYGVPTLTAGSGGYSGRGFTLDSSTADEYLARLARIEEIPRAVGGAGRARAAVLARHLPHEAGAVHVLRGAPASRTSSGIAAGTCTRSTSVCARPTSCGRRRTCAGSRTGRSTRASRICSLRLRAPGSTASALSERSTGDSRRRAALNGGTPAPARRTRRRTRERARGTRAARRRGRVAERGDRRAGGVERQCALDAQLAAGVSEPLPGGGSRSEHEVGGASVAEAVLRRADDELRAAVAVQVVGEGDGAACAVERGGAVEAVAAILEARRARRSRSSAARGGRRPPRPRAR